MTKEGEEITMKIGNADARKVEIEAGNAIRAAVAAAQDEEKATTEVDQDLKAETEKTMTKVNIKANMS
jgi:hypothetical protein